MVDVAIVGAGYTGLWTAYYLKRADPGLRIAIIEAEVAGFGASGRNGGWCSALYPVSLPTLAREHGRDQAIRQYRAMQQTVAEVGRVVAAEQLSVDWARGGTVTLARSRPQLERAAAEVEQARTFGFGPDDLRLLDAAEARAGCVAGSYVLGGQLHPALRGDPAGQAGPLAGRAGQRARRRRSTSRPRSPRSNRAGVRTEHGDLRAELIVRATEGFTPSLARASPNGSRRSTR